MKKKALFFIFLFVCLNGFYSNEIGFVIDIPEYILNDVKEIYYISDNIIDLHNIIIKKDDNVKIFTSSFDKELLYFNRLTSNIIYNTKSINESIYGEEGDKISKKEYFFNDLNQVTSINKYYFDGWIFEPDENLYKKFEYNGNKIKYFESYDGYNIYKVNFNYNNDKLDNVVYNFRDKTYTEEYKYLNDSDYICEPSYDLTLINRHESEIDKKEFKRIKDGLFTTYETTYILDGSLYLKSNKKYKKNKLIKEIYIGYKKGNVDFQNKTVYIYDDTDVDYTPADSFDTLRLRTEPNTDSEVMRTLIPGEKLKLLNRGNYEEINGVNGQWVKVKTDQGKEGWSFNAYLILWRDEEQSKSTEDNKTEEITTKNNNETDSVDKESKKEKKGFINFIKGFFK